jgi:hypothetical protein
VSRTRHSGSTVEATKECTANAKLQPVVRRANQYREMGDSSGKVRVSPARYKPAARSIACKTRSECSLDSLQPLFRQTTKVERRCDF